jgi:NAD(P)-dependent dehydrogenase (short-subunit alcohol dehydrogenase family)
MTAPVATKGSFALHGTIAVVTAGCSGIGIQIAEALTELGACVVATSRDSAKAAKFEQAMDGRIFGRNLVFDAQAVGQFVDDVVAEFGSLNVLVNTVGGTPKNIPVDLIGVDDMMEQFRDGCVSAFLCAQAVVKRREQTGIRSIVNIGSIYGSLAPDQRIYADDTDRLSPVSYACSKGALVQMTRYLAAYWGPLGVRVNSVSCGGIRRMQPERFLSRYANRVPMARMAEPKEVSSAVAFLASEASSYVTGVDLPVDGGLHAW